MDPRRPIDLRRSNISTNLLPPGTERKMAAPGCDAALARLSSLHRPAATMAPMHQRVMPSVMPIPHGLVAAGTDGRPWEPIAIVDDVPPGSMLRVTRGDLDVLLVHSDKGLCATDDRCPHMSAPLSLGSLDGCIVACPLHSG